MDVRRLSIIGVGLLGGSVGLAARSYLTNCKVTGYGHRRQTLEKAQEVGAIDHGSDNLGKAVEGADLVVLCTPVGLFGPMLEGIAAHLKRGAMVTDVGSTKRSVVELAEKMLPKHATFIGSHPMAGSEKRGVEFARTDLFAGALCILTPTAHTPAATVKDLEHFWKALGMRTCRMTPAEHDTALAQVSHLPHAVAASLVSMQSELAMQLAGKGFLDTTRIAGGDGALWRDIFLDNADNMRASLAKLREALDEFEKMLDAGVGDGEALRRWLDQAAARREALLQAKLREVNPD